MKKIFIVIMTILMTLCLFSGCANNPQGGSTVPTIPDNPNIPDIPNRPNTGNGSSVLTIPDVPQDIPGQYFSAASEKGTLIELRYDTYESFSYEQKTTSLNKRAIVYLPYGYSEEVNYNVMYLMHGGWSNETTILGTPTHRLSYL